MDISGMWWFIWIDENNIENREFVGKLLTEKIVPTFYLKDNPSTINLTKITL